MVQFGLSENIIFWGFKCLFSSLNIKRNIENQERSSYLSLVNEKIRLKIVGDPWQITFVTLNKFCLLNTLLLFLMDSIKLDGVPSKIKWKIHGCFTCILLIKSYMIQPCTWHFYFLLSYISFYIGRLTFYSISELYSPLSEKLSLSSIFSI